MPKNVLDAKIMTGRLGKRMQKERATGRKKNGATLLTKQMFEQFLESVFTRFTRQYKNTRLVGDTSPVLLQL